MEVWPDANIRGCRFHLGQSWWKRIQVLGLATVYNANPSAPESYFLKNFFVLPFLKPEDVIDPETL